MNLETGLRQVGKIGLVKIWRRLSLSVLWLSDWPLACTLNIRYGLVEIQYMPSFKIYSVLWPIPSDW
jgi:hypothetical protein